MTLLLTEEQASLADAVRSWASSGDVLAHARTEPSYDDDIAAALAGAEQLGLLTLLDDDQGGTQADLAVVAMELGHAGSPAPVVESALARRSGLAGEGVFVLALTAPEQPPVLGKPGGDGELVLTGRVEAVASGAQADALLVAARTDAGEVLAVVETAAPGVTRTPRTTLDVTRPIAMVELDGVTVTPAAWTGDDAVLAVISDAYALHVAADAVGAATRLLAQTVAYVQQREQFGRIIGSFQAVKHHAATMALTVEAATAAVRAAAASFATDDEDARAHAVSVAAAYAKPGCARVAGTAIQLHGGMGFTWESDVHVLVRRIQTDHALAGTPAWHRRRLARLLG